jgi:hypothetical protein
MVYERFDMSIVYDWKITQTDYLVETGFITTAHWTCTGTDGEYIASVYSTSSFNPSTPAIPYNNVTEQDVLDWIWSNGVGKDTVEASLAGQIEALKHPTQATGLPWGAA